MIALASSATIGAAHRAPQSNQHRASASTSDPPLIDLAGYQQAVAKYRGKPLMASFWATWCEPCQAEFPEIVQLAKEYQPRGLTVIGVSLDNDADMHLVRHFLAQMHPPFRSYRQKPGIDVDAFYQGVNPRWTGTMPETIFYGRDGRIAGDLVGGQTRETLEKAIQFILASPGSQTNKQ